MEAQIYNPSFREVETKDSEVKVIFNYVATLKPTWTTGHHNTKGKKKTTATNYWAFRRVQ